MNIARCKAQKNNCFYYIKLNYSDLNTFLDIWTWQRFLCMYLRFSLNKFIKSYKTIDNKVSTTKLQLKSPTPLKNNLENMFVFSYFKTIMHRLRFLYHFFFHFAYIEIRGYFLLTSCTTNIQRRHSVTL